MKRYVSLLSCLAIGLLLIFGLTACGSSSDEEQADTIEVVELEPQEESDAVEAEPTEEASVPQETTSPALEETEPATEPEPEPETEPEPQVTESTATEEEIPFKQVDDFSIAYQTDYAHCTDDVVILGNNETLSIWMTASPAGLVEDDFIFYFEEGALSYTVDSIKNDSAHNSTEIKLTVRSLKEGYHEFWILSTYDFLTLGEESPAIVLDIHGLNSRDGRVVYVTPTGDKYHFSPDCAGVNAFETTLYDVEALEYKPCGKCVD